jgi:transcriptional regulator with XRE-family HTH domain
MQQPNTWRELLTFILNDPRERQRLADELGIRTITLNRWLSGETAPRPQNMRHLLNALPQYRDQLLDLLRLEKGFEDLTTTIDDDSAKEIPSAFYIRVFNARASTIESLRFWTIGSLILQQALGQLDPDRLGMAIIVVRCMPPPARSRKVRSLRESIGVGTPPWFGDLEQQALFLGAESLAGYAVSLCRPAANQDIASDSTFVPTSPGEHEKSAVAYPILYAGHVAGCLLVSSTQVNYFLSQTRAALIQSYADLLALAFEPEDFYDPQDIELHVMPPHPIQRQRFANFRQRVANTMIQAVQKQHPINNLQAEQIVWQELEEELLQLSTSQ